MKSLKRIESQIIKSQNYYHEERTDKKIGTFVWSVDCSHCLSAGNFPVKMRINPSTGAISELTLKGDNRSMNWVVKTDGTQYPWVKDNYGLGIGILYGG